MKAKLMWTGLFFSLIACQPVTSNPPTPSASSVLPSATPSPQPSISVSPSASTPPSLEPSPSLPSSPLPTISPHPVEIVAGNGQTGHKDGPALQASFTIPVEMCLDPQNDTLYILDQHRLRQLTAEGQIITLAGTDKPGMQDGPGPQAQFNSPSSCGVDQTGKVYIADRLNQRIRVWDKGQVSTFLGTDQRESVDGDKQTARLSSPNYLAVLPDGKFYVSNMYDLRVWDGQTLKTLLPATDSGTVGKGNYYLGDFGPKTSILDIWDINVTLEGDIYLAHSNQGMTFISQAQKVYHFYMGETPYTKRASELFYKGQNSEDMSAFYSIFHIVGLTFHPESKRLFGTSTNSLFEILLEKNPQNPESNVVTLASIAFGKTFKGVVHPVISSKGDLYFVGQQENNSFAIMKIKVPL